MTEETPDLDTSGLEHGIPAEKTMSCVDGKSASFKEIEALERKSMCKSLSEREFAHGFVGYVFQPLVRIATGGSPESAMAMQEAILQMTPKLVVLSLIHI